MVAETLTATRAADTFPVFKSVGSGVVCAAYGTYEIAANVEAGDIFEMCKVPKGATLIGGWLTPMKIMLRFMTASFNKRDLFAGYERPVKN